MFRSKHKEEKKKEDPKKTKDDKKSKSKSKKDDKKTKSKDKKDSKSTSKAPPSAGPTSSAPSSIRKEPSSARKEPSSAALDPMPSPKEVDAIFDALLKKLVPGEGQREAMKSRFTTAEDKWMLVCSNKKLLEMTVEENKKPEYFLDLLKNNKCSVKELEDLRVTLSGSSDWLYNFLDSAGLDLLYSTLKDLHDNNTTADGAEKIAEICRCLKSIMNDERGIEEVLNHDLTIPYLVGSLDFIKSRTLSVTIQVLATLCLLAPSLHQDLIDSLKEPSVFSTDSEEHTRWTYLCKNLDKNNIDVKIAMMQLINSILTVQKDTDESSSDFVEDLRELDIPRVVTRIRKGQTKEELVVMLEIYDEMSVATFDGFKQDVGNQNKSKEDETFRRLLEKVQGTPFEESAMDLVERIALVPTEGKSSKTLWDLIDKFVTSSAMLDLPKDKRVSEEEIAKLVSEATFPYLLHREPEPVVASIPVESTAQVAPPPEVRVEIQTVTVVDKEKEKEFLEKEQELNRKLKEASDKFQELESQLKTAEQKLQEALANPPAAGGPPPPPGGAEEPPAGGPPPPGGGPAPPGGGPPPPGGGPPPPGGGGPPPPGGGPPPPGGGGGPPPPGGGGPPPPGGGPPGAPGAFGGGFGGAPARPKKPSPKIENKLKQFNWVKLPDAKTLDTVWDDKAGGIDESALELESDPIFQLFAAAQPRAIEKPGAANAAAKPKFHSHLDARRNQNISIMLARFKLSNEAIRVAIETCSDEVLTVDNLVALKQYLPSSEELSMIQSDTEPEMLENSDKFFLELGKINGNLQERLECLWIRKVWKPKADDFDRSVGNLTAALNQTKSSEKLKSILLMTLAVGNIINTGTPRGAAYGFKLESLIKMADVRTNSPETPTLLHYVESQLRQKFADVFGAPNLPAVKDQLTSLESATRENVGQLQTDLGTLKTQAKLVDNSIKNTEPVEGAPTDKFETLMKQFSEMSSKILATIEAKWDEVNTIGKDVLKFFGEREDLNLNEFLDTTWKFVQLMERAKSDNFKKMEATRKAAELEERKKNAAAGRGAGRGVGGAGAGAAGAGPGPRPGAVGAGGRGRGAGGPVMDNLLGALATGDAFRGGARGRGQTAANPNVQNEAMAMFARLKARGEPAGGT